MDNDLDDIPVRLEVAVVRMRSARLGREAYVFLQIYIFYFSLFAMSKIHTDIIWGSNDFVTGPNAH